MGDNNALLHIFGMTMGPYGNLVGEIPEQWLSQFEHAFFEQLDLANIIYVKVDTVIRFGLPGAVRAEHRTNAMILQQPEYVFRELGINVARYIINEVKDFGDEEHCILFSSVTANNRAVVKHSFGQQSRYENTPCILEIRPEYTIVPKTHDAVTPKQLWSNIAQQYTHL